MLRAPVRLAAPGETPISLDEAKRHLRIEHGEDDSLLATFVDAAIMHLDGWSGVLGRCLVTQTWRQDFDCWPSRHLTLPFPDCSQPQVSYIGTSGDEAVLEGAFGEPVNAAWSSILPRILSPLVDLPSLHPNCGSVRVTFVTGFGQTAEVPPPIKAAILLMVADLYRNRDTTGFGAGAASRIPMSMTVDALIAPYRRLAV